MKIAFFISPHGFGHAARACAVMQAIEQISPDVVFEVYTRVPRWFFQESHLPQYSYHDCQTDLGLVQQNSLQEDIPATLEKLSLFLPFKSDLVMGLAAEIERADCQLVVCDIAPLGIAVAKTAGLKCVLVENFTWDWIYENYLPEAPEFQEFITYLTDWFSQADYHIQTAPVCNPVPCHITTSPVSRIHREPPQEILNRLEIPVEAASILITMGGIESEFLLTQRLDAFPDVYFIIPGGSATIQHQKNCILLPHHSGFYHPDLVRAAGAVIGKLGYSTLAEAYYANRPYGFIPRSRFRESLPLSRFVMEKMDGLLISESTYQSGDWLKLIPALLEQSQNKPPRENGAPEVAKFLLSIGQTSA